MSAEADIIIEVGTKKSLLNEKEGWIFKKNKDLNEKEKLFKIGVLGNKGKGKTYVLSEIFNLKKEETDNSTQNKPKNNSTQSELGENSLTLKKLDKDEIIVVDSPGLNNLLLKKPDDKDLLTNQGMFEAFSDKKFCEDFIISYLIQGTSFVIVVLGQTDYNEQNCLWKIINFVVEHKKCENFIILVVHNLKSIKNEVKIEEYKQKLSSKNILEIIKEKNITMKHFFLGNKEALKVHNDGEVKKIKEALNVHNDGEVKKIKEALKKSKREFSFEDSLKEALKPLEITASLKISLDKIKGEGIIKLKINQNLKYKEEPELENFFEEYFEPNYSYYITQDKDKSFNLVVEIEVSGKVTSKTVQRIDDTYNFGEGRRQWFTIKGDLEESSKDIILFEASNIPTRKKFIVNFDLCADNSISFSSALELEKSKDGIVEVIFKGKENKKGEMITFQDTTAPLKIVIQENKKKKST